MLCILIPSSLTIDVADERVKTYKVGQVARAASIFCVDEIVIYKDREHDDSRFIEKVLKYAETPQYLRKRLFGLEPELRFVGLIPPLRTKHHPTASKKASLEVGEFREGVVVSKDAKKALVDIGVEEYAVLRRGGDARGRVTVKVVSKEPLEVQLARREEIPFYWGYVVRRGGSLGKTLKKSGRKCKIIFTSRLGVFDVEPMKKIFKGDIAFVFGSPSRGLKEILADEGLTYEDFGGHVVNTVPGQGTATVRTEEAIFCTLAAYNILRH
ncbi:putative RNA uridine N3 methyltransferase [Candidatus Alkanophaga liquidiphilum]